MQHGSKDESLPGLGLEFLWLFFFFFVFSRATPVAYGGSQARGLIGAVVAGLWPRPEPQKLGI